MEAELQQQAAEVLSEAEENEEPEAPEALSKEEPAIESESSIEPDSSPIELPSEEQIDAEPAEPVQTEPAEPEEIEETPSKESGPAETAPASPGVQETPDYQPTAYVTVQVPSVTMSTTDFTSSRNRAEIQKIADLIVQSEAPILKESLTKRILSSFGVGKNASTLEAVEKALKAARIKNSKYKGVVFCWAPAQDPNTYTGIRVSNERPADEISPQEIKNAACYVLRQSGPLEKDALVKAISVLFGYKRLGKNLEAAISNALPFARANGYIVIEGGKYKVAE